MHIYTAYLHICDIHTEIYTDRCIYINICINVYIYVCIYVHICVCTYGCYKWYDLICSLIYIYTPKQLKSKR